MEVAVVVYPGVLADECRAFRSVLEHAPHTTVVNVGAHLGVVGGPGGGQIAERTYADMPRPDVVVVPGGLGCDRAADDLALRAWITDAADTARFVVASSTGTIVLAAAGLLRGRRAATHWLAAGHLDRYGVEHATRRMEVSGQVITCEGRITALDAAYAVVERCHGAEIVAGIRRLLEPRPPDRSEQSDRFGRPGRPGRSHMIELVANDHDGRPHRRRRRAMR